MGVTEAAVAIIVAILALVGSSVAAYFSYKGQRQTKTTNGHDAGELIESIHERVGRMEMWLVEHIRNSEAHHRIDEHRGR